MVDTVSLDTVPTSTRCYSMTDVPENTTSIYGTIEFHHLAFTIKTNRIFGSTTYLR